MAIAFNHLLQGVDSTNSLATYTTASITPATDGSPIAVWVCVTRLSSTVATPTPTGLGLTWSGSGLTSTQRDNGAVIMKLLLFKGIGTASSGTVSFSMSNSSSTGVMWSFVQMPGAHTTLPFGSPINKIESTSTGTATSTSLTLPSSPTAGNAVMGCVAHNASETITAGTNFTKDVGSTTMATPNCAINYEYKTTSLNTTVDASWASTVGYVAAGIEVVAAGGGGGIVDFMGDIPI